MRHAYSFVLAASLAACNPQAPPNDTNPPTTSSTSTSTQTASHGLQSFRGRSLPLLSGGPFMPASSPSPGTATFTQATYDADPSQPPPSFGGGSIAVTLDGTAYDDSTVQSFYMNANDDSGTSYLLVGSLQQDPTTNLFDVLYVVTKTSDFAVGADVALDGVDRMALFAHGDPNQPEPSVYAIATSGTVHFSAGSTSGAAIDATLSAQFAIADDMSQGADGGTTRGPDAGADGGTTPPPPPTVQLPAPGSATLFVEVGAPNVNCAQSMSGQESTYAAVTGQQLGLRSGPVAIEAVQPTQLTLSGQVLSQMFAQTDVTFTYNANTPEPIFEADLPDTVLQGGPSGSTQQGVMLYFDSFSSTHLGGEVIVVFTDAQRDGYCELAYPLSVTTN